MGEAHCPRPCSQRRLKTSVISAVRVDACHLCLVDAFVGKATLPLPFDLAEFRGQYSADGHGKGVVS